MGTRSLVFVKDVDGRDIFCLYRQFDGYPSGMGVDLHEGFGDVTITNGISSRDTGKTANGMSCLAAQIVTYLKGDSVGNVYMHPVDRGADYGEEYRYTIKYGGSEEDYYRGKADQPLLLEVEECLFLHYDAESQQMVRTFINIWDGSLKDFDPEIAEANSKRLREIVYQKCAERIEEE